MSDACNQEHVCVVCLLYAFLTVCFLFLKGDTVYATVVPELDEKELEKTVNPIVQEYFEHGDTKEVQVRNRGENGNKQCKSQDEQKTFASPVGCKHDSSTHTLQAPCILNCLSSCNSKIVNEKMFTLNSQVK